MQTQKNPHPLTANGEKTNKNIIKGSIPQFFITLHPNVFKTKESFNLARITNDFKRGLATPTQHTLQEILQLGSQGRCLIPSFIEYEDDNYYFVSSRLIFLDIDDVQMTRDPLIVFNDLKEVSFGGFYTSSHLIDGFRYRIGFCLDKAITSQSDYKAVCKQLTKRLLQMGVPADTSSQDGLQRIRTSMNGYVLGNVNARLCVDEYLELDKLDQEQQRKANVHKKVKQITELADYKNNDNTITFEELKDMANHIGYIPSGSGQKDEWISCVLGLKSYANLDMITQEQGEELFDIVSGGEQKSNAWNKLNPSNVTIGSFIHIATTRGYKRDFKYFHAIGHSTTKNIETVKFDEYIDVEFMKDLIKSEQQILIDAATGSGKTSSVIKSCKELSKSPDALPSRYYLFAVPMRSIAKQVANEYDILEVVGGTDDVFNKIKEYSDQKNRVIAATYDIIPAIVEMIKNKKINPFASFTIIVDEIHYFTIGYSYRTKAIDELQGLRKYAKGFIGLSGTPQDTLKDGFDRQIKIQTNKEIAPCRTFGAITWSKQEGESAEIAEKKALIEMIKARVKAGKRLLVYIQNRKMIEIVKEVLVDSGIKTDAVTSEFKSIKGEKSTYQQIVDESCFPSDVQVILSTSVLMDGINLALNANDLECVVVCSSNSKLFDPSLIRQSSNRYRTNNDFKFYDYFYVFMPESQADTKYHFNIESAYSHLNKLATNAVNLLNAEFARPDDKRLATIAALEEKYGIYIDEAENEFKYKPLKIRELSYREKTGFYGTYRDKFIEACSKILGVPAAPTISIKQLLEDNQKEVANVAQTLEMLRQTALEDDEYKTAQIKNTFNWDVYRAFNAIDEDDETNKKIIYEFKKAANVIHYGSLKELAKVVDYNTCLHLIDYVTSNRNMYSFIDNTDALCKITYFDAIRRSTPTKKIFNELKKYIGKQLTANEKKVMISAVAKKLKLSKEDDVKKIIENYFEHHSSRSNKQKFTSIEVLTIEAVSNKFDVPIVTVKNAMFETCKKDTDIQQVILKMKAN